MRLYLIRHGETVDNVAGVYAGVRDSALTIHGVEQARRLGKHLADNDVKLTHIFSSPLTRAFKTAEALQIAQLSDRDASDVDEKLHVEKVPDLIEQDFGYYEGKSFFARSEAKKTGKATHLEKHKDDPGFVDVESRESMAKRADAFLDEHLIPLLKGTDGDELVIAIVSHGILLGSLWRRLLLRLSRKSLSIAPEITAARDNLVLEHLGGWSNTGYLELQLCKTVAEKASKDAIPSSPKSELSVEKIFASVSASDPTAPTESIVPNEILAKQSPPSPVAVVERRLLGWTTRIVAIDSKQHLVGLKRQRGGIGRLAHDEGQRKLGEFFKRQKKA